MVTITLDIPEVIHDNTPWEPLYGLYTPNEMNESTTEIVIQELINQKIIFEALHYFTLASVGCGRTA